jgi:hypothetical protein
VAGALFAARPAAALRPYLERMSLDRPRGAREWLQQRLLAAELRKDLA